MIEITTNKGIQSFLDSNNLSSYYTDEKDGIKFDFKKWDNELMEKFIPIVDEYFFKLLCKSDRNFLSRVKYDMVEHIDLFDIVCDDIVKSQKSDWGDYILPMFTNAPKDYQLRVIKNFHNNSSVLSFIIYYIIKFNNVKRITLQEVYEDSPSIFNSKKVLDTIYRNISNLAENFFVSIFDKVCPKETNMTLDDFTLNYVMNPFNTRSSFGPRMMRSMCGFGYPNSEKNPYFYDHINKKPDFTKEYEEFKSDFEISRKELFREILKNNSYSLAAAKSLGYEDVYHDLYKDAWCNKNLEEKRKSIQKIANIRVDENGEEYIRINSNKKETKEGLMIQSQNFFGINRHGYRPFDTYLTRDVEIADKDAKSFVKILFMDIDCVTNSIYANKYTLLNVDPKVEKVTMTKEDIAKKLGIDPQNLTIKV